METDVHKSLQIKLRNAETLSQQNKWKRYRKMFTGRLFEYAETLSQQNKWKLYGANLDELLNYAETLSQQNKWKHILRKITQEV